MLHKEINVCRIDPPKPGFYQLIIGMWYSFMKRFDMDEEQIKC